MAMGGLALSGMFPTSSTFAQTMAAPNQAGLAVPELCAAPDELLIFDKPLKRVARRIEKGKYIRIVALGSTSTLGGGASGPEAAYPARLQALLGNAIEGAEIKVVNKGVAKDSALRMVDRFQADVIDAKAHMVIWETGTNDAVIRLGLDDFDSALDKGIQMAQAQGIDVILMTPMYARNTAAIIDFSPYMDDMRAVAARNGISVFQRYEIMEHWARTGRVEFDRLPKPERAKMADQVYDCLARLLAGVIINRLK
jgi:hypothetical protein